jgi:hypothetical protein
MPHLALVTTDPGLQDLIEPVVRRLNAQLTIVPDAAALQPSTVDAIFWPIGEFSSAVAARFDTYCIPIILLAPQQANLPARPQWRRRSTADYVAVFPFDPDELAKVIAQSIMRSLIQRFTERRLRKRYASFVEPLDIPGSDDSSQY